MRFNINAPLGYLAAIAVIVFSIWHAENSSTVFLNIHAAVIVFGGTLAATMICFPLPHLYNLAKLYFRTISGKAEAQVGQVYEEVLDTAKKLKSGTPLITAIEQCKNHFFKESLGLLEEGTLSFQEIEEVLEKRIYEQEDRYRREATTYKVMAKFPPAFGLIGTSVGMVQMLQGLGQENAFATLGPSMSITLVATFYGLVFANFVIIPVAENLVHASELDLAARKLVLDGVRLIHSKKHPILVAEHLKSYLAPRDRNEIARKAA